MGAVPDLIHLYKRILTRILTKIMNCTFTNGVSLLSVELIKKFFPDLPEKFYNTNDCSRLSDTKPLKLFNVKRLFQLHQHFSDQNARILFCYILLMIPTTGTFLNTNPTGFIELCYVVEHTLLLYFYFLRDKFTPN